MANTLAPFGLQAFGHRDGSAPTAGFERRFIASSDTATYFTGDVVQMSTQSNYLSLPTSGIKQVAGVFMGCEYYSPSVGRVVWSRYFPGSVATSSGTADALAYVITDPEMMFIAQCSTTATISSTQIGLNIGVSSASQANGSTLTGTSAVTLASTSTATTSTLPFRVVDFYSNFAPGSPNTSGVVQFTGVSFVNGTDNSTSGQIMVVAPNNWERNQLTALT